MRLRRASAAAAGSADAFASPVGGCVKASPHSLGGARSLGRCFPEGRARWGMEVMVG